MLERQTLQPAVFLDRDGVLIEDVDLLVSPAQVRLINGAAEAVKVLRGSGRLVVVVSNQTVVARGLVTEEDVQAVHDHIQRLLLTEGGETVDAFYFCPHHPNATLPQYRVACDCRKPRPGLLLQAAAERGIDLSRSWMIGDRITDIIAGRNAGCRAILVHSGRHLNVPIESPDPIDVVTRPDLVCRDMLEAAPMIVGEDR